MISTVIYVYECHASGNFYWTTTPCDDEHLYCLKCNDYDTLVYEIPLKDVFEDIQKKRGL